MRARLVSSALLALVFFPVAATADSGGIAFDQAQRVYVGETPAPPVLGTFEDFSATFELRGPSVEFPPLPGVVPGAAGTQPQAMLANLARLREGVFYHYSFLGRLVRVDDPSSGHTTIGRPDKGEIDFLDTKAKTFRILRGAAASAQLAPAMTTQMKAVIPQQPSGTPSGTAQFAIEATQSALGSRTFEGIPTDGLAVSVALKTRTHTGSCSAISVTVASRTYADLLHDERVSLTDQNADPREVLRSMQSHQGCVATFSGDFPKRDPLLAHFYLYNRYDLTFDIPSLPAPVTATTIMERGHVTALADSDAALFEIPTNFTEAAPASTDPTPAPVK